MLQLKKCLYVFVLFSFINLSTATAQNTGQIDVITKNVRANDIVYDQHRDVIYATVKALAGPPNGNSIVVLDPATLNIIDQIFVGGGPSKLAISNDGSRVYVGLNGANSFRYYEPGTGTLGPLYPVRGSGFNNAPGDPAVVEDMVVSPTDPKVVIVSSDQVGSSAAGNIEIFDDTGKIGGVDAVHGPKSIAFVDDETLIGLDNDSSASTVSRYTLEGNELTLDREARNVVAGSATFIEASGGLIYFNSGQVMDPSSLTLLGSFQGGSGSVEASVEDGLVYFYDHFGLTVCDTTTFLRIDRSPPTGSAKTLDFAGENRLAFLRYNGEVGVMSGVQLTPPPLPIINLAGTVGDDELLFDLGNREYTLNGTRTSVPSLANKFRFNGLSGQDSIRFIGDQSDSELAVLRSNFFSVAGDNFSFSARNCNDVEFVSDSDDDIAIFFDSVDQDDVVVTPGRIVLRNNMSKLAATSVARGFVYSQGGDDNITFRGGLEKEILVANAEQRRISLRNHSFSVTSRGFLNAQVNAGIGFDTGWVVGSSGDDYYYALGNYGYLFNDAGIAYGFKEIESMNVRSESGNDVGVLQQTADSTVRGNSVWKSMTGPGFSHSLSNFHRVVVREE